MEINRIENNANRGREITHTYFSSKRDYNVNVFSETLTEVDEKMKILLHPIGKINPDLDKFHIE